MLSARSDVTFALSLSLSLSLSPVPADVTATYTLPAGQGAILFTPPAPAAQTDCSYLIDSPLSQSEDTHAVLGRCNFCESPARVTQ